MKQVKQSKKPKLGKIMVIDDSELTLEMVRTVLCDTYDLALFSKGTDALIAIRDIAPDMILLDYEMPNLNGLEIIHLIKEDQALAAIPVIFITSYNDVKFELEAFKRGAVDYIHKPFSPVLLKKRIEVHLEHARRQAELASHNEDLMTVLEKQTTVIKELQYAIVFTLSDLVEMRDQSTGSHIYRTTEYYKLILRQLEKLGLYSTQMKGIDQELVLEAAQLHDIGKVAIPDAILLKPAKLTTDEFEVMKTHTTIGYNAIIKAMQLTHNKDFLSLAAMVALTHHERWDGTGYPNALGGDGIPLVGRIMAIVDVYDAIVSERPYKKAMSHDFAMKEILDGRGNHFDPVLVDAVMEIANDFKHVPKKVKPFVLQEGRQM